MDSLLKLQSAKENLREAELLILEKISEMIRQIDRNDKKSDIGRQPSLVISQPMAIMKRVSAYRSAPKSKD